MWPSFTAVKSAPKWNCTLPQLCFETTSTKSLKDGGLSNTCTSSSIFSNSPCSLTEPPWKIRTKRSIYKIQKPKTFSIILMELNHLQKYLYVVYYPLLKLISHCHYLTLTNVVFGTCKSLLSLNSGTEIHLSISKTSNHEHTTIYNNYLQIKKLTLINNNN